MLTNSMDEQQDILRNNLLADFFQQIITLKIFVINTQTFVMTTVILEKFECSRNYE